VNKVDYKGKYSTNLTTSVNTEIYQSMVFFVLTYNPISITVNPTAHKGIISIYLKKTSPYMNGDFSEVLLMMYQSYKEQYGKKTAENIYYILAVISTYIFYENFPSVYCQNVTENTYKNLIKKREFLFNDECVADEIKAHCEGYWYSLGKNKATFHSNMLYAGVLFNKAELNKRCSPIDIAEQDVCDLMDSTAFGYYLGIRDKYLFTKADPYFRAGKREYYVRADWKTNPILV
jgi:hypothetical protein